MDWDTLEVYIDKNDVIEDILIDDVEGKFTLSSDLLSKGTHSIEFTISDMAGNVASAKYDVKVK